MENANPSAFEVALNATKSKAAGSLKAADIKRLIKLLGKRPNEIGVRQITELIVSESDNEVLVYELLCEIEMARNPDMTLAILKPALSQIATTWMETPPPIGQQPEVLDWLRAEAAKIMSSTQPNLRRFRGVLLWLLSQYRSPDFFLTCLVELSQRLRKLKRSSLTKPRVVDGAATGFVMARIAKELVALGRGKRPKLTKLPEIGVTIESVLTHVDEKVSEADTAIDKLERTEQSLATEKALSQQQAATIHALEASRNGLENQLKTLNDEFSRLKTLHQLALDHAQSQISEARTTMLTNLKSKIQPKLTDARLYANRPTPAVDQVLRLVGEIEQSLNSQEIKA